MATNKKRLARVKKDEVSESGEVQVAKIKEAKNPISGLELAVTLGGVALCAFGLLGYFMLFK